MNFVHALRGVTLANEGKAEGQQEKRILVRDEVRRDEVRRAAMMMVASCCFLFTTKFALTDPSLCQVIGGSPACLLCYPLTKCPAG